MFYFLYKNLKPIGNQNIAFIVKAILFFVLFGIHKTWYYKKFKNGGGHMGIIVNVEQQRT
jgi:hypothetical protein